MRLKAPRDKRRESAGLFLQAAYYFKMIHALFECLAHAKHHRGRSPHAQLVRGAMDADPVFRAALQARDALAHVVVQNLRAAAGDRVEARVAQPGDSVA